MVKHTEPYIIPPWILKRIVNNGKPSRGVCRRCGEPHKPWDRVLSKRGWGGRSLLYCEDCAVQLGLAKPSDWDQCKASAFMIRNLVERK